MTLRTNDLLPEDKRQKALDELIDYFNSELGEEIGVLAAENLLDHMVQVLGKDIYNKGLNDAERLMIERIEGLRIDIDLLKKS